MKKSALVVIAIVAIALFNYSATTPADSPARVVVNKMLNAISASKGWKFTMKSEERITSMKTGLRGGDILTKVNIAPKKIYMNMLTDPNKGTEILYVEGERDNKVLVNPGKFLPTLSLNPFNSLLSKDQHHTALSAGFGLITKIVGDGVKRADEQNKFDVVFKLGADVNFQGRNCYSLTIEDPSWTYTTYTAKKGENMYSVSQKLLIPEYSLIELDGVKNFEEDLGGKTLKVPTSYAKKTLFYIDKENNFPIYQEMSDDKGIFERYTFSGLVVNPAFKADEFTKGFSEYKF